ncbi:hypothetical protein CGRA01v4_05394 [Colletotrichum graminicola]|nr:hypothetical protein CGRA01v4_05394 [Colletotrichum graminicola]
MNLSLFPDNDMSDKERPRSSTRVWARGHKKGSMARRTGNDDFRRKTSIERFGKQSEEKSQAMARRMTILFPLGTAQNSPKPNLSGCGLDIAVRRQGPLFSTPTSATRRRAPKVSGGKRRSTADSALILLHGSKRRSITSAQREVPLNLASEVGCTVANQAAAGRHDGDLRGACLQIVVVCRRDGNAGPLPPIRSFAWPGSVGLWAGRWWRNGVAQAVRRQCRSKQAP